MLIKICGVRDPVTASAAVDAGADMIGLVFFEQSPRNVSIAAAREIAGAAPGATRVGLFVDPADALLEARRDGLDEVQLHGAETTLRIKDVRARLELPVMKAIGVSDVHDVRAAADYAGVADRILFDAKPPKDAERPGGLGATFDWAVLDGYSAATPWMLSGGLTPENVGAAVRAARGMPGFSGVDVSSGVERAPGEKDIARIRAFIDAARGAMAAG